MCVEVGDVLGEVAADGLGVAGRAGARRQFPQYGRCAQHPIVVAELRLAVKGVSRNRHFRQRVVSPRMARRMCRFDEADSENFSEPTVPRPRTILPYHASPLGVRSQALGPICLHWEILV